MEQDVMSTTIDVEKKIAFQTLGVAGEGGIEAKEGQMERLDEFTNRVGSGEFHRATAGQIPCTCVDGRCNTEKDALMPNAAGGSETLMVADDLTTKDFELDGDATTRGQYGKLLNFLKEAGYPIGGHIDCGANMKLPAIYAYIKRNGDMLRSTATSLGYEVSNDDHELITGNAGERSDFSDGDEMLDAIYNEDGRVDTLEGEHMEVVALIDRRQGTTLDRDAVQAEFGDNYKAFNVDEWTFEESARVISHMGGEDEARQKRISMLYYNLATAGVLCGPNMRVVVVE